MIAVPMELKDAQNYINTYHRHHQAAHRDKFRIAAMEDGKIVGVVQVGRPVSRMDAIKHLLSTGKRQKMIIHLL
jgi:ABC-type microcin C transport system duplicated ATPase subunit YejF